MNINIDVMEYIKDYMEKVTQKRAEKLEDTMTLTDKTINIFEKRVAQLTKTTDITKLPQWNVIDVITASCLLIEYRKLQSVEKIQENSEERSRCIAYADARCDACDIAET